MKRRGVSLQKNTDGNIVFRLYFFCVAVGVDELGSLRITLLKLPNIAIIQLFKIASAHHCLRKHILDVCRLTP